MPTILATTIIGIGIATKRSFEAANFEVALGGLLFRVIDFADLRRGSPRQIDAAIACPVRPAFGTKRTSRTVDLQCDQRIRALIGGNPGHWWPYESHLIRS